jgi:hypothetical protein
MSMELVTPITGLAGYEHSLRGANRQILLGNLGNDLVKQTSTRR